MRSGGRIDDRVVAVLLDLGVVPVRPLSAGVLEERYLRRPLRECLGRSVRVEGDLHPLPVALMDIVELVEVVEEEVLDDQARVARLGGDVGIGDRGRPVGGPECLEVRRVAAHLRALNVEGIPRQVEVVVVAETGYVSRRGALLDRHVLAADVVDELHRRVPEHGVHRGRRAVLLLRGIAVVVVRLLAQHQVRRIGGDELLLLGRCDGHGACRERERGGRDRDEERRQPSGSAQHGANLTRSPPLTNRVFPGSTPRRPRSCGRAGRC